MKEIWMDIPGYEGKYQVSNLGKIFSYLSNKELLLSTDTGYKRIKLLNKTYLVHRLVFCTFNGLSLDFNGQKSKTLILHKNDIKTDCRLNNLFLGTQKDNMQDMIKKGRCNRGIIKKRKIGYEDIVSIKQKYKELKNIFKVAKIYGVTGATISRVINGKIWNNSVITGDDEDNTNTEKLSTLNIETEQQIY